MANMFRTVGSQQFAQPQSRASQFDCRQFAPVQPLGLHGLSSPFDTFPNQLCNEHRPKVSGGCWNCAIHQQYFSAE